MGYAAVALALAVIFIYLMLASQFGSFLQPRRDHGLAAALADRRVARAADHRHDAQHLLDDRLHHADGPGHQERDPAGRLRQPGARARAQTAHEAMLEAGQVRLRPILMTTAAMIFGMLPLALGIGEGGETRAPMAHAVIGGLVTSTLLTLVVVPVIYSYLDDLSAWAKRKWGGN